MNDKKSYFDIGRFEGLDRVIWPVPIYVKDALGLKFSNESFIVDKTPVDISSFVSDSYSYYSRLSEDAIAQLCAARKSINNLCSQ